MLPYGKNISFPKVIKIVKLSLYSQSNSPYEVRGADFFDHNTHRVAITFLNPYCMI